MREAYVVLSHDHEAGEARVLGVYATEAEARQWVGRVEPHLLFIDRVGVGVPPPAADPYPGYRERPFAPAAVETVVYRGE